MWRTRTQAFRSRFPWGTITAKVIAAVGTGLFITRHGMHRRVPSCANASPAVRGTITDIGDMAAGTATLTGMDIPMGTGMAIAAK